MTYRSLVMGRGGDWRHPGVYSIIHVPTGLEYIGASASVRNRVQQHLSAASSYADGRKANPAATWLPKLHLALTFLQHGPIPGVDSLDDVRQLSRFECCDALNSAKTRGIAATLLKDEICPLWVCTCPNDAEAIRQAEREAYSRRQPVLNGPTYIGYGCTNEESYTSQERARWELDEPPEPVTDAWVKALPLIARLHDLSSRQINQNRSIDYIRQLLAQRIAEKSLQSAEQAFAATKQKLTDGMGQDFQDHVHMASAIFRRNLHKLY